MHRQVHEKSCTLVRVSGRVSSTNIHEGMRHTLATTSAGCKNTSSHTTYPKTELYEAPLPYNEEEEEEESEKRETMLMIWFLPSSRQEKMVVPDPPTLYWGHRHGGE